MPWIDVIRSIAREHCRLEVEKSVSSSRSQMLYRPRVVLFLSTIDRRPQFDGHISGPRMRNTREVNIDVRINRGSPAPVERCRVPGCCGCGEDSGAKNRTQGQGCSIGKVIL